MRLSEKKSAELYNAIVDPIMDRRVDVSRFGSPSGEELDAMLFKLAREIWAKVHKALNLDSPP